MKNINIRLAYAHDFDAMHALNQLSFIEAWSEDAMRGALLGGFDVLVAEADSVLCGYIFSCDIVDEVHIMQLAVHPAWQRQGIARRLSQTLLHTKRAMQCILLELRASNHAALALYQHLGFAVCGERSGYYAARHEKAAESAILMRLNMDGNYE